MQNGEKYANSKTEAVSISLPDGWGGRVVVRDAAGKRFSRTQWVKLLGSPEQLSDNASEVIKDDEKSVVIVKELSAEGKQVKGVIKFHSRGRGVREFFRSLAKPRAISNFNTAVNAAGTGVQVGPGLAALYRRRFLGCRESIYISEFVEGVNLHKFLSQLPSEDIARHRVMNRLSEQLAEVFAALHKNGLWHRDAKASNFIVSGDNYDNYKVVLTDMDGIKPYFICRADRQMRALWRLAASIMIIPSIGRTDYTRLFRAYCERMGIPKGQRGGIFRRVAKKASYKYRVMQGRQ